MPASIEMVEEIASPSSLYRSLVSGLAELSVRLADKQLAQLLQYVALLDKWNKVYNLTAVRDQARMVNLHLLDSIGVVRYLGGVRSMVDVGTGAGLPGIPIAIACPDIKITLLDTIAKKTTFVRQAISELQLGNAIVATERVERFHPPQKFDVVISRAFAELKDFVDNAGHLANERGKLLAMKGLYPHDEIARLPDTVQVTAAHQIQVPGLDAQRHLVVIEKI